MSSCPYGKKSKKENQEAESKNYRLGDRPAVRFSQTETTITQAPA